MDRRVFTALLLAVIVVGLVYLTVAVFAPFLLGLLWAGVLAIVTYQAYDRLASAIKGRRTLAAAAMTLAVLLLIIGPCLTIAILLTEDAIRLAEDLRPENIRAQLESLEDDPLVARALAWVRNYTGEDFDFKEVVPEVSGKILEPLAKAAGDVIGFLFGMLATLFFITLSIFYFYKDGPGAVTVLRELIPMSDEDRDTILGDIKGAIEAAVRGGLVVAIVQGILGFIILFILGFERPVLWASVMALASFIPLVGTAIIWLPMAGVLAYNGHLAKALVLVGYGVLVIGMADNLLRPLLVGQHMEVHPLLLFFGILGSISLFGFVGIILGPVVVAFLTAITRLFRREFAGPATSP